MGQLQVQLTHARGCDAPLGPVHALRRAVLAAPGDRRGGDLPGDDDADAWHVLAHAGTQLIAAGLLVSDAAPFDEEVRWRLRAMVVLPAWRGRGVGRALVVGRLALCAGEPAWARVRPGASLAVHTAVGGVLVGEPVVDPLAWHDGSMVDIRHPARPL